MQKDEIVKRLKDISDKNIKNINGYNEENVKIHVVTEILKILGHSDHLDLEHNYGTDRPDIFIKGFEMPILIEVKGANEDIDSHIQQIKKYSYNIDSLLSILTNGNLFYFFSPFWKRKSFDERLILLFSLEDLRNEEIANKVISLLNRDLGFKQISKNIEQMETGILAKEKEINEKQSNISDLENKVKSIGEKYPDIEQWKKHIEYLDQKIKSEVQDYLHIKEQISERKDEIGRLTKQIPSITLNKIIKMPESGNRSIYTSKKKKVNLSQLVQYGKIKEGDKLFFYDRIRRKRYEEEYAFVAGDKLLYRRDNRFYSPSDLAKKLRKDVHLTDAEQETQGPIFWITENGKILDDLNDEVREILYGHDNAI